MGRVPLIYVPHYCGEKNWVGNTHYMPHTIIVTRKIRTERNASENISNQRVSIEASMEAYLASRTHSFAQLPTAHTAVSFVFRLVFSTGFSTSHPVLAGNTDLVRTRLLFWQVIDHVNIDYYYSVEAAPSADGRVSPNRKTTSKLRHHHLRCRDYIYSAGPTFHH